jgi:hypothetical protein
VTEGIRRFLRGRWHLLFGHPPEYVGVFYSVPLDKSHATRFFCYECRRYFWKVI